MRCPECNLENEAHVTQCVECGTVLTQAALMDTTPNRTNQVWNTDIDADRNRKNSRTALAALGVTVLLVIALVVAVVLYLPRVISYSMDSIDLPEIDFSEIIDELFWQELTGAKREPEPAPEPDYPPADRLRGADFDFINALTAYAIELSYAEDADMQREIHQMFYPELEHLAVQEYEYHALYVLAQDTHRVALLLSDPAIDSVEALELLNELSTIIWTVQEGFYFLSDYPDILDYYANLQVYTEAMLEVEYVLQAQLIGAETVWHKEFGCEAVFFTNHTPYTMDLRFTNDFVTDTAHYSSEYSVGGLMPGGTEGIPLYDLEKIGDKDHTWHLNWEVEALYLNGEPLEPWGNIIYETIDVWGYS